MRRASVKIVGGCVLAAYLVLNASAWAGIYSQVVGADDPVAYWRLGESSSSQTAVNSATGLVALAPPPTEPIRLAWAWVQRA
jgi:hypothetical protein